MKRKAQYDDFHEAIITGTMQLLAQKSLSNLPVTEICKRAGVSRQAFYRHFDHKNQVVLEYFEPIYGEFLGSLAHSSDLTTEKVAEKLVDFFENQAEEIRKATKSDYYLLIFQIFSEKLAEFYNTTTTWTDYVDMKRDFWNDFMSAGIFYVLGNWAKNGCVEPKEAVVKMIIEFHQ